MPIDDNLWTTSADWWDWQTWQKYEFSSVKSSGDKNTFKDDCKFASTGTCKIDVESSLILSKPHLSHVIVTVKETYSHNFKRNHILSRNTNT